MKWGLAMETLWGEIEKRGSGTVVRDFHEGWGRRRLWYSNEPKPLYRWLYSLNWGPEDREVACWILFNPSFADDAPPHGRHPALYQMVHASKRLGMQGLIIVNLFALRDGSPDVLRVRAAKGEDPIGCENDYAIGLAAQTARSVIAAWGSHGSRCARRASEVIRILSNQELSCLGCTAKGQPKYPLYLPHDTPLERFVPREGVNR
jgi:hypothetical protein